MARNHIKAPGVGKAGACLPGASNQLNRDDDTQQFLDNALSDSDDGTVMSREKLLAVSEQEVDLENGPHPAEDCP